MQRAIDLVAPENAELGRQMGELLGDLARGMGR
jgi:hypothetical protein